MTALALNESELAVLLALEDGEWRVPSEIAELASVHVQTVRACLKEMAQRHLVERGGWGSSVNWGDWRLTEAGASQLRLRNGQMTIDQALGEGRR